MAHNGKFVNNLFGKPRIFVGLGNPGKKYAIHRHNVGFMVVDEIAREQALTWRTTKQQISVCVATIGEAQCLLVKPLTYMNLSGNAVAALIRRIGSNPADLVVIHDDMDLNLGRIRVKVGGGDGGHKGIRSISESLGFRDFVRVRLGVGRPPDGMPPERYVLSGFSEDEKPLRDGLIVRAIDTLILILTEGIERAKNVIHSDRAFE
jgi:peptidyl-tRNA hydrolase, PTH1 family